MGWLSFSEQDSREQFGLANPKALNKNNPIESLREELIEQSENQKS